jgi:hypothetical protein
MASPRGRSAAGNFFSKKACKKENYLVAFPFQHLYLTLLSPSETCLSTLSLASHAYWLQKIGEIHLMTLEKLTKLGID